MTELKHVRQLKHVRITDSGDGSTFITLTFDDDSKAYMNPDIPYDGYYEANIADGKIVDEQEVYE